MPKNVATGGGQARASRAQAGPRRLDCQHASPGWSHGANPARPWAAVEGWGLLTPHRPCPGSPSSLFTRKQASQVLEHVGAGGSLGTVHSTHTCRRREAGNAWRHGPAHPTWTSTGPPHPGLSRGPRQPLSGNMASRAGHSLPLCLGIGLQAHLSTQAALCPLPLCPPEETLGDSRAPSG